MPRKALLVIDMQKDLCYNPRRKKKVLQMLIPLKEIIDLFHQKGLPIFYIAFSLDENDQQFKRFGDRYCIEGTEGAKIIPELFPLKGKIIKKRKHSAFFETELDTLLKKEKVSDIYLTGMQTQICIMTTAADASFRGYRPVAVSDCVLSTKEKRKSEALNWIKKYVGEVLSLSEVSGEITHG